MQILPCIRCEQFFFEGIARRVVNFAERKVWQASLRCNNEKIINNQRYFF